MSTLEKLLVAQVASAVLVMGYGAWQSHQQAIGESRATVRYTAAIEKQKLTAVAQLATETAKVSVATQALQNLKTDQEKKDAQNQNAIGALAARLHTAAGPTGRLRDPNAAAGCRGSGGGAQSADPASAGNSAGDDAKAGGLLSADLTGLLFEQARAADAINVAYASCRADALSVREVLR